MPEKKKTTAKKSTAKKPAIRTSAAVPKINSKEALTAWGQLREIFQDGKVDPKEIPVLLSVMAEVLKSISAVLSVVNADPKVMAILIAVSEVLENLAEGSEKQIPKIEQAVKQIQKVLEDQDVDISEIPALLEGITNIIEAFISMGLPFVTPEFTDNAQKIARKIQKVLKWVQKLPGLGGIGSQPERKIMI